MQPLVSVIIPVYNVSQYLRKCLDSVINQTLKDIEIIIVNDCSPDPLDDEICREYALKEDRIVYIKHEENLGLGGARNTGIKVSKAMYVGGVDSDDWIAPNMFELLYNNAVETGADIVAGGFSFVHEGENIEDGVYQCHTHVEEVNPHTIFTVTNPAFWNKLWKKTLFIDNQIFFPEHLYFEDFPTTPVVVLLAKKISFIDQVVYSYRQRNTSIVGSPSRKHIDDSIKGIMLLQERLFNLEYMKEYKDVYYTGVMSHITFMVGRIMNASDAPEMKFMLMIYLYKALFQLEDIHDLLLYNNIVSEDLYHILPVYKKEYNSKYEILCHEYDRIKSENDIIKNNRWYVFGTYSRYHKCKVIISYIIKRLFSCFKFKTY